MGLDGDRTYVLFGPGRRTRSAGVETVAKESTGVYWISLGASHFGVVAIGPDGVDTTLSMAS